MSRKGPNKIRKIVPDSRFDSPVVAKLINYVMKRGQKLTAQKQIYTAMDIIAKQNSKQKPLDILQIALDNIKPKVEVRPRRIGGAVYQVPTPVRAFRQNSLAIRWLVNFSRQRSSQQYHSFAQKIAAEIIEAGNNQGPSVAKRLEVEKMADANKAFAHLRW